MQNRATSRTGADENNTAWIGRPAESNTMTLYGNVRFDYQIPVPVTFHDAPQFFAELMAEQIPLGRHASSHLLGADLPMGRMRDRVHRVRGRQVVPTYHPAYLLRSPHMKRACWQDIQRAMGILEAGG